MVVPKLLISHSQWWRVAIAPASERRHRTGRGSTPGTGWWLVESAADHVLTRKDQTRHEAEKNPWQKNKKIKQI
jgi:hypothetical protein